MTFLTLRVASVPVPKSSFLIVFVYLGAAFPLDIRFWPIHGPTRVPRPELPRIPVLNTSFKLDILKIHLQFILARRL